MTRPPGSGAGCLLQGGKSRRTRQGRQNWAAFPHASTDEEKKAPELIRLVGDIRLRKGEYKEAAGSFLKYLKARPYDAHAAELRVFIMVHMIDGKRTR